MKPDFIMMVGLPGSGKTTLANSFPDYCVISSDEIRKEMYGDISNQSHNDDVFKELHRRVKKALVGGKNVIYDATNINKRQRVHFITKELATIDCSKECLCVMYPYKLCLNQNKNRERSIPEEVITRMYMNWQPPHRSEGWDNVTYYIPSDCANYIKNNFNIYDFQNYKYGDFDQRSSYHSKSLGEHLIETSMFFKDTKDTDLFFAALLHDIGKPFTQNFIDSKGNPSNDAHYYRHENVGAYDSFFYLISQHKEYEKYSQYMNWGFIDDVTNLIYYHMKPYTSWKASEKVMKRDRNLLGYELFNKIIRLHEADRAAH